MPEPGRRRSERGAGCRAGSSDLSVAAGVLCVRGGTGGAEYGHRVGCCAQEQAGDIGEEGFVASDVFVTAYLSKTGRVGQVYSLYRFFAD